MTASDSKRTAVTIVLPLIAALIATLATWGFVGARLAAAETERDESLERVADLESQAADLEAQVASLTAALTVSAETPTAPIAEPPHGSPQAADGRYFCFVREIDTSGGATMITVDFAELLTGAEAAAAAAAAGDESPPPNDYYIRNVNPLLRTFPVQAGITVRAVTGPDGVRPEGFSAALSEWVGIYESMPAARDVPYWIEIEDETVAAIEEQYLP